MCGILGGIHKSLTSDLVRDHLRQMAHRGPDDQGVFHAKNVWLGHVRLSIQDISDRGHQPMTSDDGNYTIVFNGEIYNHWEIRKELEAKGVVFHSQSDTETLLQAYITYGKDCVLRFNGMFAFAIFDNVKEELWIARDHFGIKPLYYYADETHFLFASELKSILHLPHVNGEPEPAVFYKYLLLLYSPGTDTPFADIKKLLPGHTITIPINDPAHFTINCYYRVPFTGSYDEKRSEEEWIDQLDKQLTKAVERQLLSDVPVGYFLSGGLDSSLILAIARKLQPDAKINAYTINTGNLFKEEGFDDDLPYARKVAALFNADLHITTSDVSILQGFDKMIWHLDEPQSDPAAFFVQQIAASARQHGIKVLLGGTAADDLFAGYKRHLALQLESNIDRIPFVLQKGLKRAGNWLPESWRTRRLKKLLSQIDQPSLQRRIGYYYWLQPEQVQNLFTDPVKEKLAKQDPFYFFSGLLNEIPNEASLLNQMLYWEMRGFLPDHNLNYTDKMGMAASVEIRVPYLDQELVALAAQMPPSLKLQGRTTKYILKKLAERYLPKEIIYRPKTGFGAPIRQWVKNEMKPFIAERLSPERLQQQGIFDPKAVAQLIAENDAGKTDAAYAIWALLAIESWIRQFDH